MKNLLGFRQYLKSPKSYDDLLKIINEQPKHFSPKEGFCTMVVLCGDNPRDFLEEKNLLKKVAFYNFSAWEESAKRVAEVHHKSRFKENRVQIIHYSANPLGFTYPIDLLVRISNLFGYDNLAISDSDFQIGYSEVRKAYDHHLLVTKEKEKVFTLPRRNPRSLDADKYPINRWAMEDLENMYIYLLSDLEVLNGRPDFQSGLSITDKAANKVFDFENVGAWIGNLHMAIQLIRDNGHLEKDFEVKTNFQHESTINFDVQCTKIDQLYRYYMIPFSNIIRLAVEHPEEYLMKDWTEGKTKREIKKTIHKIEEMNNEFLREQGR